jgi:dTDP-glucose pyrophosphorylase
MTTSIDLLLVSPELSLVEATARMTDGGKRIVLVVDTDRRLLGIVADHEVRRAILDHRDFTRPVSDFMIREPSTAPASTTEEELRRLFETTGHYQIPLIDTERRVVGLRFMDEFISTPARSRGGIAVVMAGGLGERLRPLTLDIPKPLLPVGGRPILFNIFDQLLSEEFEKIYVCANYKAEAIIHAIDSVPRYRSHTQVVLENERMGTAGGLGLLPQRPTSHFLVLNADLLTNISFRDLLNFHHERGNALTMAIKQEIFRVPYGVVDVKDMRITEISEKPEYKHFINAGVYVLNPEVLDMLPPGKPFNMTDVIQMMIGAQQKVGGYPVYDHWLDIGNPDQFERAQLEYSLLARKHDR